ncbi:redox-sensitive transcriptional activator SoxR [Parahaliea aestuarii]|uniref:Redox-sensitive transcriptional activator SoxR n=1 Tax=Parahaliea aestuarii TaxID=1852021 RepID=A0A5C8ZNA5_9GAMM|nr:redox-sensitive transcriptional activator SoxR [Parahaliea aestuarii]TXS89986.1 redox-sensitive transcriptional activator SoxR [Parahaliea aestuarii]
MERQELSVGQVAKRCGVSVSALHFYERRGLIFSGRNAGNQRRYGKDVIRRVSVIRAAQQLGVTLAEIEAAFASLPRHKAPNRRHWQALSEGWHEALSSRIRKLEKLRDSLTGCIGCGCLSMDNCPLYNPEDVLGEERSGPVILDRDP